jgi:hypothetical protein
MDVATKGGWKEGNTAILLAVAALHQANIKLATDILEGLASLLNCMG